MAIFYLLKEDGGKITLEDVSGSIILEASSIPGPSVDWQAGGRGRPVKRRNRTEELFDEIEHALLVAMGLVDEPVEVTATAIAEPVSTPAWSEGRFREAIDDFRRLEQDSAEASERLRRLEAMLAAYEKIIEREKLLSEDEETWLLMS